MTHSKHNPEKQLLEAERLVEIAEGLSRTPQNWKRYLIPGIAFCWSLFQLSLPQILLVNSTFVRCIHLAFALALVFLSYPAIRPSLRPISKKKRNSKFSFLHETRDIPWIDLILAFLAALSALYIVFDFEGVSSRQGLSSNLDLAAGTLLLCLLLEAARRSLGLALPGIAAGFIVYSFFSEHFPILLALKNASFSKIINKLSLSTEGIFGVPLDVSASTVFLFVLFGALLERAGGGKYFIDLAFSLLGRYRGGPAKAAVLSSGLTGMVSGSSIANTVTTGTFTIPLMKRAGYTGVKAGAIEVAASVNGQLMPPIMGAAAFIMAEYCNLSYAAVVKAAFIPATLTYLGLLYVTHLEALKLNLKPTQAVDLPRFGPTLLSGIYYFIPLFLLLYQLIILRHSPQLSVYLATLALAAIVVAKELLVFWRKGQSLSRGLKHALTILFDAMVSGAKSMMSIGVAVATAGIVVAIVTLGLGGVITELITVASMGNLYLLLLITALVSLILGMGLPTTANYIVMATLTAPVIVKVGGDMGLEIPLIAAHLFVFYFGILADATPPVGLAAFAAAAISGESPMKTGLQGFYYCLKIAILPFMFLFNLDLLLYQVDNIAQAAFIFITSLAGIFAFASLLQGYFQKPNHWIDSLLLLFCTFVLFRPTFFGTLTKLPPTLVLLLGLGLLVSLALWQRHRPSQGRLR